MMQVKKVGKPFSMQSFYFPAIPDSTAAQKNDAGIAGQGEHGGVRLSWDFLGFLSGCAQW